MTSLARPQTTPARRRAEAAALPPLLLGTRGSQLATTQAGWVANLVTEACGRRVELVTVSTVGDESDRPIEQLGSTGVFVTALREALLRGEIDFVVHSYKDLPAAPCPGVRIGAVPTRADPRDALVCRTGSTLADLPPGARVGTGSPRRASQILARGYPVRFVPLRGNVDTRLRKLADGEVDAVVLAVAGLARLDRLDVVSSVLEPAIVLPAPAQGALAVECRDDDAATSTLLSMVDDDRTRATVAAERGFLAELDGGCTAPVGALAELRGTGGATQLVLDAVVGTADGTGLLRRQAVGGPTDGDWLGRELARSMLHDGAAALLGAHPATPDGRPPSLASPVSKGERR